MKHLKQSTCFDIGLIIDFDNTLFENEGDDWTVDNFTDERLKLRELLKMSFPDTILCSGRHVSQRKEIDTYLRKYTNSPNWYFLWEFDYDIIDEYRYTFMITYWKWKMEKIVELKWKYKHGVIVVDDDKVICDMCKKFEVLPEFYEVLLSWLKYKRARGESYKTANSTELAYKKLLRLSGKDPNKATKVIEQSMENNWAGLFRLNEEKQSSTNNRSGNKETFIDQDYTQT